LNIYYHSPTWSWGSSVNTVTRPRTGQPGFDSQQRQWRVLFAAESTSFLHSPTLLSNGYRGLFATGKAARAWSWPLISIYCRD